MLVVGDRSHCHPCKVKEASKLVTLILNAQNICKYKDINNFTWGIIDPHYMLVLGDRLPSQLLTLLYLSNLLQLVLEFIFSCLLSTMEQYQDFKFKSF
jgi:hypothetical protein